MLNIDHLIGRPFKHGSTDCYGLVRDFYKDVFGIELTNYARPDNWWDQGLDLYTDNFHAEGFRLLDVHPREYQTGDVFLMAIRSKVANHTAVLLPDGQVLHHLLGCLSRVDAYQGLLRNTTVAVVRHKDVDLSKIITTDTVDLMELLPDAVRRKLAAAVPDRGQGEGGVRPEVGAGG